ncbi:KxYKxGKxW signal peptide domain-containing protein [Leuconostoc sp. JNUCC 76]
MENSKKYKSYKFGKLWVFGAVAVAAVAVSANTTQVSADTVHKQLKLLIPRKMTSKFN